MKTRRQFIAHSALATSAGFSMAAPQFGPWRTLFDGNSLDGWKPTPRIGVHRLLRSAAGRTLTKEQVKEAAMRWARENRMPKAVINHHGDWRIVDGAIVGGQKPAGCRHGAYLMTEDVFGDIELEYEIHPDWPTDTGVLIRQHEIGALGFQILCDHRPNGGIGGVYTNGLGSYIAAPFVVQGDRREKYQVKNLREGEKDSRFKQGHVQQAATFEEFSEVWKLNDFNHFRVRAIGAEPLITVWINGLKIGTIDTFNPGLPQYDPEQIQRLVGAQGHIGLEVHSNGPKPGWDQWGNGAVSRWRNIRVREMLAL